MFSTTVRNLSFHLPESFSHELKIPAKDTTRSGNAFLIRGHVVGEGPPKVQLQVAASNQPLRTWPVEVTECKGRWRYDLSAVVNLLGSTGKTLISFQLIGENNWRTPVATIELERHSLEQAAEGLPGIYVVSLGRSGSTMMMSALAAHPDVVAYERHPFETRVSQQYARIAKTLTEPADFFDPQLEAFAHSAKLASNAYLRPDGDIIDVMDKTLGTQNIAHCRRQVTSFYQELASRRKKTARAYAEKCIPHIAWLNLLRELYPGSKVVLLVRDFRDVYRSVLSFNDKRGFNAFGREAVAKDIDYVDALARSATALMTVAKMEDVVLAKYEDIAIRPADALTKLMQQLDLEGSEHNLELMTNALAKDTPEVNRHRTAGSSETSVGRWQSEVTEEEGARFQELLTPALKFFDYQT
ncbi:sulfotransferase [Labrenzia sp. PHM005]|uniref:sulfotransferase family protein n=1 Tax=Labrenzia sp. PHM005 TaxID=2590016 RepID=UPI00143D469E|nr:sulfotransferase [Labrenzia sp. PHM005]